MQGVAPREAHLDLEIPIDLRLAHEGEAHLGLGLGLGTVRAAWAGMNTRSVGGYEYGSRSLAVR